MPGIVGGQEVWTIACRQEDPVFPAAPCNLTISRSTSRAAIFNQPATCVPKSKNRAL
jgi:hypothetical protein